MRNTLEAQVKIMHIPQTTTNRKTKSISFRFAFLGLSLVAFASALDATIFAIALPIVALDLKATTLESFWAGISFLLTSVAFLPAHITLSDIFGRKPILYLCMFFFSVGSIVIGLAKNGTTLVIGRTIQGIGGGGLEALSEIILTDITTLKERPLYLGILGFMFAGGAVLGPIVGGLFAQYVSWRWIAWINLPLMGLAILIVPFFLKLKTTNTSLGGRFKQVDVIGLLLFVSGLSSLILGIAWGGQLYAWNDWQTILPLVIGILLLCILVSWEWRQRTPMIPMYSLKDITISMSLLGAFIHGILLWAEVFYLPIYFQGALQQSPMASVISGFPTVFTVTPLSIVCAIAIEVSRSYRWAIWSGWVLTVVGFGIMTMLSSTSSHALYSGLQIPAGIGTGLLFPALNIPLQAAAAIDDVGTMTGLLVFSRALGSAFGVSLGATVFSNEFGKFLSRLSLPESLGLQDASRAVDNIPIVKNLDVSNAVRMSILDVYGMSLRTVWLVLACISAIGLLSGFLIKGYDIEGEEEGRQSFREKGTSGDL